MLWQKSNCMPEVSYFSNSCCCKTNKENQCKKKETDKKESEDPYKSGCNPFMPCALCFYVVTESQVISPLQLQLKQDHLAV